MTDASRDDVLDDTLAPLGRMSFLQDCSVNAAAGRVVMNDREIFLALADGAHTLHRAAFEDASVEGAGLERQVRLGSAVISIRLPDEYAADRFARVLKVRKQAARLGAPQAGIRLGGVSRSLPDVRSGYGRNRMWASPQQAYHRWRSYVMWTSSLLLVIGSLNLVGGVIVALVLLANGAGVWALLWLVLAAAGCAMPMCLGSLARMVTYRHTMEDQRAS